MLATVVTSGVIFLGQPSLRSLLPIGDGHDVLSHFILTAWTMFMNLNTNTLTLVFWVVGTILGVWITLLVAGQEMRSRWFKEMIDRLPVR